MKAITFSAGLLFLTAQAASAKPCPAAVPFEEHDRLEELAARCDVSPEAILRANDARSEADLRAAGAVAIPQHRDEDASGLLDRAGTVLEDTADRAGSIATEAGDAASDYVAGTELGQSVMEELEPSAPAPQFSFQRVSPQIFRLEASGLPPGTPVTLTLWQGQTRLAEWSGAADARGAIAAELQAADHDTSGPPPRAELHADDGRLILQATAD